MPRGGKDRRSVHQQPNYFIGWNTILTSCYVAFELLEIPFRNGMLKITQQGTWSFSISRQRSLLFRILKLFVILSPK